MTLGLIVRPLAERDIRAAHSHYERERPGLGIQFEEALNSAIARILEYPMTYSRAHRDVRRVVLERFPYGLFYRIRGNMVHVLAVKHLSRHPSRWQRRG